MPPEVEMPNLKEALETNDQPQAPVAGQGIPEGELDQATEDDSFSFVTEAFEELNQDDDSPEADQNIPQNDAKSGEQEPPQAAPKEQPQSDAKEPPQPVQQVQPVQPQPGQAPQQQPVPQQPVANPQGSPDATQALNALHQALGEKRDEYIKQTASSLEATFTEDDINEFHDNPKVALSKLGARLHHDIVHNMMGMIAAKIPEVVHGLMTVQKESSAREDAFFAEYPHLAPHRSNPQFASIAAMVRQTNPQADAQTYSRLLATMAGTYFGAQPQPQQHTTQRQPQRRAPPGYVPAGGNNPAPAQRQNRPAPGSADYWGMTYDLDEATEDGRINGL